MDKLFAIKIKYQNGTYSESIPIGVIAEDVKWDNTYDLKDIIGHNIKVDDNQVPISLQAQIDDKVNSDTFENYMDSKLEADFGTWLTENEERFLKKQDHLKYQNQRSEYSSNNVSENEIETRQYPIRFDHDGKLSVNVPWTDTIFNPKLNNLWTGRIVSTSYHSSIRIINLDNYEGFFPLTNGKTIAVYGAGDGSNKSITQLYIQGNYYPVYIKAKTSSPYYIKMEDVEDQDYFKQVTIGYNFFTYITSPTEPGFLLTSANSNIKAIRTLEDKKADLDSPVFTGTPMAPTPNAETSAQIATTEFVQNEMDNVLKIVDLKTTNPSEIQSNNASNMQGRQYPVEYDSQGKLSVNVPWTQDEIQSVIQRIWTGYCPNGISMVNKEVLLDEPNNFPLPLQEGTTILVRTLGNIAENPKLNITNLPPQQQGGNERSTGNIDITYSINAIDESSGNERSVIVAMTDPLYYKWGRGIKMFTYHIDNNSGSWILQNVDQETIHQLVNQLDSKLRLKANLESPVFTGTPTAPTSVKITNSNVLATTKFVHDVVDQEIDNLENNITQINNAIDTLEDNIDNQLSTAINDLQGDINNLESNINNLTEKENDIETSLGDVYISDTTSIQLTNLGSLQDNNWNSSGFTLISQSQSLKTYQYSYQSLVTNPYIQYSLPGGKEEYPEGFFGFKYKISLNPNFSEIEQCPIKVLINNNIIFNSNKINEWVNVSYSALSTLQNIKISYQKGNYNYSGNINFEIKDFYVYDAHKITYNRLNDNQIISFINKIIQQQNNLFKNGTVTYSYTYKKADDTLSIYNAAADAHYVGEMFSGFGVRLFQDADTVSENDVSIYRQSCCRIGNFIALNFVLNVKHNIPDNTPIFKTSDDNRYKGKNVDIVMSNRPGYGNGLLIWKSNENVIRTNGILEYGGNPTYYYCSTIVPCLVDYSILYG